MPLGVGWGQNVGLTDFYHILTLLPPWASLFHKHMSSFYWNLEKINALSNLHYHPSVRWRTCVACGSFDNKALLPLKLDYKTDRQTLEKVISVIHSAEHRWWKVWSTWPLIKWNSVDVIHAKHWTDFDEEKWTLLEVSIQLSSVRAYLSTVS